MDAESISTCYGLSFIQIVGIGGWKIEYDWIECKHPQKPILWSVWSFMKCS